MHAPAGLTRTALVAVAGVASACAPTRALAPLEPGQGAFTASLGGPIVEVFGGPVPLPVTSVGYVRGIDGKTNLHGALYPTNLVLFGVFGFDLGASYELFGPNKARPRLMADVTAYTFFGNLAEGDPKGGARVFPDLQVIASWPVGGARTRLVPYVGADNFVELLPTQHWNPSLVLGNEFRIGERVGLQLEAKWIAPWADTTPYVTHWYAPGNRGAISAQLGFTVYAGEGSP